VSTPAVTLRGVARRYGRRWALRGIDLAVAPEELVGITGHNGSGKSTLLRVICTALRPSAGEGWVYGHHLVREGAAVRAQAGFLGHVPGLYDDLSGHENLRFAAAMFDADHSRIAPLLERVGLWRDRDERVRGYSAGMQRRLALARLLLQQPRLLLLDEPYNNFDRDGIALVNDVLDETRRRGGAAMVVVHEGRQGAGYLNRLLELSRGLIAADGAAPAAGHAPPERSATALARDAR
jgi:heme exporter protein A